MVKKESYRSQSCRKKQSCIVLVDYTKTTQTDFQFKPSIVVADKT